MKLIKNNEAYDIHVSKCGNIEMNLNEKSVMNLVVDEELEASINVMDYTNIIERNGVNNEVQFFFNRKCSS